MRRKICFLNLACDRRNFDCRAVSQSDFVLHDQCRSLPTLFGAYRVVPEIEQITPNNRDLCYFDIFIEDENGNIVTDADNEIECSLFGGELMGIFGGNPKNEDQYGSNKCHVFYGKAVAVARSRYAGELKIYIKSNGLKSGTSSVKVK